jgi:hypothetical protein
MRRYSFDLTADGKASVEWLRKNYEEDSARVIAAAKQVLEAGNFDYIDLSFAAKAHWVLRQTSNAMSDSDISREATRFGWKVQPEQIHRGVQFLFKIGLARTTKKPQALPQ